MSLARGHCGEVFHEILDWTKKTQRTNISNISNIVNIIRVSSWHLFLITKPMCRKSMEKPRKNKKQTNPSSSAFCKAAWSAWPISDCAVKTGPKQLPDENRPLRKGPRKHKYVPIFVSSSTVVALPSYYLRIVMIIALRTSLNLALKNLAVSHSILVAPLQGGLERMFLRSRHDSTQIFPCLFLGICNGKGITVHGLTCFKYN